MLPFFHMCDHVLLFAQVKIILPHDYITMTAGLININIIIGTQHDKCNSSSHFHKLQRCMIRPT